jgi:hypothetical protein
MIHSKPFYPILDVLGKNLKKKTVRTKTEEKKGHMIKSSSSKKEHVLQFVLILNRH